MAAAITSLAFVPRSDSTGAAHGGGSDPSALLAVGLESGDLQLWALSWAKQGASVTHDDVDA
jgi:hypothetical protein